MKRAARIANDLEDVEFSGPSTPTELSKYVDISMAIKRHFVNFVNSPQCKQKDIASNLGKHESEISKWLSGEHNLTLKSIIKLEAVCNIGLLNPEVIKKNKEVVHQKNEITFFVKARSTFKSINSAKSGLLTGRNRVNEQTNRFIKYYTKSHESLIPTSL
jgi:transcriptional regulator with XRE-family HTH domain